MNNNYYRREFLKKTSVIAATIALTPFVANSFAGTNSSKGDYTDGKLTPRINPAFRIQHFSDGSLELYTFQKPGSKIGYHYGGLEASILLLLAENKPIEANLKELAADYSLSDSACKTQIFSAMDEFKKKGLVYYGDLMIVKKTEVSHE
jgi:hypothetical protein